MLHNSIYSSNQLFLFYTSIFLMCLSIILFYKKSYSISVFLLFSGSLALGLFLGILDPYLYYWDEQFHALVAKNMMEHPFEPMLYKNPEVGYSYQVWVGNNIWLHKQPLFLWQMALSMKIFGATTIALRLPSVLMHSIMVLLVYRIGCNMISRKTGYYGAFLFTLSFYFLEMMIGFRSTDHNDVAFIFYTTASIWAWTEFNLSKNKKWIFAIGLFSGCAVLNKWLPGLLVYGAWGASILSNKEDLSIKAYLLPVYSFLISVAVFLPWQIYTFFRFPVESKYEYDLNVLHFSQPVEGHDGNWTFHFNHLSSLYGFGDFAPWILLLGLTLLLVFGKENRIRVFIFTAVVAVYGFYSVAATKMISFPLVVSVFAFLSMGVVLDQFEELLNKYIKYPKIISIFVLTLLLFFGYLSLNIKELEKDHTFIYGDNPTKNLKEKELVVFDYIMNQVPDTSYTFFNVPFMSNVPFMFHKGVHAAYDFCPNEEQYVDLKNRNIKFVVIDNNQKNIPEYILKDSTTKIVRNPYW